MNETNKNKAIQILENLDDRLYIRMKIIDNRNIIMILFNLGLLFILMSKTQFTQKEIICLNLISIIFFIFGLKTRKIKVMGYDIGEKNIINQEKSAFETDLLDTYLAMDKFNDKVIENKHRCFDFGFWLTIIQIIWFGITFFI